MRSRGPAPGRIAYARSPATHSHVDHGGAPQPSGPEAWPAAEASAPPLGLLTVASLVPADWEKRPIDVNAQSLRQKDLDWADMVFISAMVQRESAGQLIARCKEARVPVVAGGPLFTQEPEHRAIPPRAPRKVRTERRNEAEVALDRPLALPCYDPPCAHSFWLFSLPCAHPDAAGGPSCLSVPKTLSRPPRTR